MAEPSDRAETYSPWTVVNLVFGHLADQGLHPTLGGSRPPGEPAAELLRCFGITPVNGGDSRTAQRVRDDLARMRETLTDSGPAGTRVSE